MNQKKAILITGATGLIGQRLCYKFSHQDISVIALTRDIDKAKELLPTVKEFIEWPDKIHTCNFSSIFQKVKCVINLGGATINKWWSNSYKNEIYNSRILATRKLLSAIESSKKIPPRLISASAIGYYGLTPKQEIENVTEEEECGKDFLAEVCKAWESEARNATRLGMKVCIARIGIVLSTRGGALKKMLPLFYLGFGGTLGKGEQWFPWVHIDDVCNALIKLVYHQPLPSTLNFVSPNPVKMRTFVKTLGKAMHRPSFFNSPEFILKFILGERHEMVTKGRKVIPSKLTDINYNFLFPTLKYALNDIIKNKK